MKSLYLTLFLFTSVIISCSKKQSDSFERQKSWDEYTYNIHGYERVWTTVDASELLNIGCEFINTIDEPNEDGAYAKEEDISISCSKSNFSKRVIHNLLSEYESRLADVLANVVQDGKRTMTMNDENVLLALRYQVILINLKYLF